MAYSRNILVDDGSATESEVKSIIMDALLRDRRDLPEVYLINGPLDTQVLVDMTGEGLYEEQEMFDALYDVFGNSVRIEE